jgi:hypothetical protein
MMEAYKGRTTMMDYPSEVYFHFRKKCFSMVQDDVVVLHSDMIVLKDCIFKVSETLRQKVIATQTKNVHAKVLGYFQGTQPESLEGFREAYYNPYHTETFVDYITGEPIYEASEVVLVAKTIYYKI